jgi:hypothetical protein
MKNRILLLIITCLFFVKCENTKENEFKLSRNENINKYLASDYKDYLAVVNESAVYGVIGNYSVEEMLNKGLGRYSEISGVDAELLINCSQEIRMKSTLIDTTNTELGSEILSQSVKESITNLFSVFSDLDNFYQISDNGTETFLFDRFSIFATGYIIAYEDEILANSEMSDIDKTIFFSMSYMFNDVLGSYEALSIFVANNFGETLKSISLGFFHNLWKGITKVASVIVTTVVSAVVNTVGSGINGTVNNGLVAGFVCTIPGVFYGLYEGIVMGVECDAFDLDCLMEYNFKYACTKPL